MTASQSLESKSLSLKSFLSKHPDLKLQKLDTGTLFIQMNKHEQQEPPDSSEYDYLKDEDTLVFKALKTGVTRELPEEIGLLVKLIRYLEVTNYYYFLSTSLPDNNGVTPPEPMTIDAYGLYRLIKENESLKAKREAHLQRKDLSRAMVCVVQDQEDLAAIVGLISGETNGMSEDLGSLIKNIRFLQTPFNDYLFFTFIEPLAEDSQLTLIDGYKVYHILKDNKNQKIIVGRKDVDTFDFVVKHADIQNICQKDDSVTTANFAKDEQLIENIMYFESPFNRYYCLYPQELKEKDPQTGETIIYYNVIDGQSMYKVIKENELKTEKSEIILLRKGETSMDKAIRIKNSEDLMCIRSLDNVLLKG